MSTVDEEIQQGNIQFLGNVWVPQSRGNLAKRISVEITGKRLYLISKP